MKKFIFSWLLSIIFLSATTAQRGEERTGYDGDFFSLEGAIELFKNSNSIADFERRLNEEDTYVNNLDLDRDGQIDFIRVEHIRQGNFHAIVLQVPLNRYDVQDIAVIEIEKTGRRRAMLQIVGDEDMYGEEVIVEPYDRYGYSGGRGGPNADYDFRRGYVNVYWWSPVQHIFGRHYRVYRSPYYWSYYPTYWRPWRPCGWNIFRPRVVIYHHHYHHVHIHRVHRVHDFYRPYRHYSHHVVHRSNEVRVKHGRPAIQRERINDGPSRTEFRPGLKKVNKTRGNSTAQVNKKGDRLKTTTPRTSTKQYGKDRTNTPRTPKASTGRDRTRTTMTRPGKSERFNSDRTNTPRTPKASTGRDRTRTTTTRPSKPERYNSDRTKATRTPKANSGGRVNQSTATKPSRSNSKLRTERSTKPSRSSSTRSTKPNVKPSSSSRKRLTRSSSSKSTRSSSSKPRSSSKATRSKSSRSAKSSKPRTSSKSRKSSGSSKKGRG